MAEKRTNDDQATGLRKKMEQHDDSTNIHTEISESLPPRTLYHKNKNQKVKIKFKLSFPLIRLLLMLFIVLVIVLLTSPYWLGNLE